PSDVAARVRARIVRRAHLGAPALPPPRGGPSPVPAPPPGGRPPLPLRHRPRRPRLRRRARPTRLAPRPGSAHPQPRPAPPLALTAVALVWLIACGNASSLLIARVTSRRRELAVRAALGASRARVVRYLLAESSLLAIGAAAVGIGIARLGIGLLRDLDAGYF